jgi:hypothetical protein
MFWVFLISLVVLVLVIRWARRDGWRPPRHGNDTDAGAWHGDD